jgi:hypothetical protein
MLVRDGRRLFAKRALPLIIESLEATSCCLRLKKMTEKQKAQQTSRPLFKSAPALFSAFNTSSLLHASDMCLGSIGRVKPES